MEAIIDYKLPLDAHYAIAASYHTIHTFQASRQKLVILQIMSLEHPLTLVTNVLIKKLIREGKVKSKVPVAIKNPKSRQPKLYKKLIQT